MIKGITTNKTIAVALVFASALLSSCVDDEKDFYDPNYRTPNPLEITAPEEFDGTTVSSAKMKIGVNDEYNGEYYYTVGIYDKNPLFEKANTLSIGVAKKGEPYEVTINYLQGTERVFIQQTDPLGRKEVAYVETSGRNGETLNYDFAQASSTPKSRAAADTRAMERPQYTVYTADDIPADAVEISSSTQIESNGNYKITQEFKGNFILYGVSNAKLFITGKWKFESRQIETGLEIIVLEGGKIEADNMHLVKSSSLEIMRGGKAEIDALQLSNENRVINLGELIVKQTSNNPGLFYNGEGATLTAKEVLSIGGAENYNDGIITAKNIVTTWGAKFVNNCQVNVEEDFRYQEGDLTLNKGAIVARNMFFNNNKIILSNGSMLKAEESINAQSGVTFTGSGENKSLLKSPKIIFTSGITYQGALVIEVDNHPKKEGDWLYKLLNGATMTTYNGSNITISTCGEEANIPTPAPNPTPTQPEDIIIDDDYTYTFAYEDQWPLYGDYDMNDLVVRISDMELEKKKESDYKYIEKLEFECEIMAVGATKNISLALQLPGISPSDIDKIEFDDENDKLNPAQLGIGKFNQNGYLEQGQSMAVIPLFYSAHQVLGGPNVINQINTIKKGHQATSKKFEVKIKFQSRKVSSFTLKDNFDLFIITDGQVGQGRKEIHLKGYAPTNLASTVYYNNNNDRSLDKQSYYTSDENLCWGFLIAQDDDDDDDDDEKDEELWRWPQEYVTITTAYSLFEQWILTGENARSWYKKYDSEKVY